LFHTMVGRYSRRMFVNLDLLTEKPQIPIQDNNFFIYFNHQDYPKNQQI